MSIIRIADSRRMQYAGSENGQTAVLSFTMPQPEFGKHRFRWVTDASD